jgi:hypothetical protein
VAQDQGSPLLNENLPSLPARDRHPWPSIALTFRDHHNHSWEPCWALQSQHQHVAGTKPESQGWGSRLAWSLARGNRLSLQKPLSLSLSLSLSVSLSPLSLPSFPYFSFFLPVLGSELRA